MSTIARAVTTVGSLYALMRQRLRLNVATPLLPNEISATSEPDRRLVVSAASPIAGFPIDHGTVADAAAMLALHTIDGATLLTEPTFVAPGDSCLRADDPDWRWHCIAGHGTTLAEWERRPLGGALTGLSVSGHTHTIAEVSGLAGALSDLGDEIDDQVETREPALGNPDADGKILSSTALGVRSWITPPSGGGGGISDDLAVCVWAERVSAAGGILGASSVARAESLMTALRTSGALPKIRLLLPLLGGDITAAIQPLIDRVGCSPVNAGFTVSDWSETAGLAGGSGKLVHLNVRPIDLGVWANGGLGYWELALPSGVSCEPFMCYRAGVDNRFGLFLRTSTPRQLFWWGAPTPTNAGSSTESAVNGHYYGQRSSGSAGGCGLYRSGSQVGAASPSADAAPGADIAQFTLMGATYTDTRTVSSYHTGRCGLAYLTDGTLTTGEITALHTALAGWLASVGRV